MAAGKGDILMFGSYPQRCADPLERTPLEWIVLDRKVGRLFCVSRYLLDCKPYHDIQQRVTWENCALRKWLNDDFFLVAFTAKERGRIILTDLKNPAQDTRDRIFILSMDEAEAYLGYEKRAAKTTAYARAQGAWFLAESEDQSDLEYLNNGSWWLRYYGEAYEKSESKYDLMSCVNFDGYIERAAQAVNEKDCSVRPALWITL